MRVAVLVQDYPSAQNPSTSAFVHSRNLWYRRAGVDVFVASFSCAEPYTFEGISVVPADSAALRSADVIASHAPNVRNHVRILRDRRTPTVFFFHGFEVLRARRYYPEPFEFQRTWRDPIRRLATDMYDTAKFVILGRFLAGQARAGAAFVFVSEWMREQFARSVPNGATTIAGSDHVIPNAVHESFADARYEPPAAADADFVTFRGSVDQPKYAVDLVVKFARANPDHSFDVYGRGELIRRLGAPGNLRHHNLAVPQAELPERASRYRAALIPSRLDAQGVTACEMATFGIPTIVSDLPVAHDVLGDFANVSFIDERGTGLSQIAARLWSQPVSAPRPDFLPSTTCAKELDVLAETLSRSG